jgi:ribosomal protein L1
MVIGEASLDEKQLPENYGVAIDEVLRHKPSSSKGRYLKRTTAYAPSRECGIAARILWASGVS